MISSLSNVLACFNAVDCMERIWYKTHDLVLLRCRPSNVCKLWVHFSVGHSCIYPTLSRQAVQVFLNASSVSGLAPCSFIHHKAKIAGTFVSKLHSIHHPLTDAQSQRSPDPDIQPLILTVNLDDLKNLNDAALKPTGLANKQPRSCLSPLLLSHLPTTETAPRSPHKPHHCVPGLQPPVR